MIKLKPGYSWETVQGNVAALVGDGMQRLNAVAVAYAFGRKSYFTKYRNGALPSWLARPHTHRMRHHYDKYFKPQYANDVEEPFAKNPTPNQSIEYAIHSDGSKAYIRETYRHGVTPSFETIVISSTGKQNSWSAHPKAVGITRKNGWTLLNPSPAPNQKNLHRAAALYREFTGRKADGVKRFSLPKIPREGLVFGELVQVGYRSARDGKLYVHPFRAKSRPSLISSFDGKLVLIVGGRYIFTERGIEDR